MTDTNSTIPKGSKTLHPFDAANKFGTRQVEVRGRKNQAGRMVGGRTVTLLGKSFYGGKEHGQDGGHYDTTVGEKAVLPLETDVGETVYILRPARYKNGNRKTGKGGMPKWEVVSDEVVKAKHVEGVSDVLKDRGYHFTHDITWETRDGTTFTTPLESPLAAKSRAHLGEYAKFAGPIRGFSNQFIFTSKEDLETFIASVESEPANSKASLGIWEGMRAQFDNAVWETDDNQFEAEPEEVFDGQHQAL